MANSSTSSITLRKWSPDEDAHLISLIESGMSFDYASKRLSDKTTDTCRARYDALLQRQKLTMGKESDDDDIMKDPEDDNYVDLGWDLEEEDEDKHHIPDNRKNYRMPLPPTICSPGKKIRICTPKLVWSLREHIILKNGLESGLKFDQIAMQLPGRSKDACRNHWAKFLKENPDEKFLGDTGLRWRKEETDLLLRLKDTGMTWELLSEQLPRHDVSSIKRKYRRLKHGSAQISSGPAAETKVKAPERDTGLEPQKLPSGPAKSQEEAPEVRFESDVSEEE